MSTIVNPAAPRDVAMHVREHQAKRVVAERHQERVEEQRPPARTKESGRGNGVDRTA
jgi:hypothetical protein